MLPMHRLGWDTTMRLYRPSSLDMGVPSWDRSVTVQEFGPSLYHTRWVIDVEGEDGKKRQFVAFVGKSLIRSEVMSGRATCAWEVLELSGGELVGNVRDPNSSG